MSSIPIRFTAEHTLGRSLQTYAVARRGTSARGLQTAAGEPCRCKSFQPGCGCVPFCHKKTGAAVAMCKKHMAENAACNTPGFACFGCTLVPHSDHAEYYVCRA